MALSTRALGHAAHVRAADSFRPFTCARPRAIDNCYKPQIAGAQVAPRPRAAPCTASRVVLLRAAGNEGLAAFDFEKPETAREAIDLGLVLCKQEKWDQALPVFEQALQLPGTGLKRFRDKPPEASDSEKMAALYNIACCHSKLEDARTGLVALAGCLELGYADFDQIVIDPDLEFLRKDSRFQGLLDRFRPKGGFLDFDLGRFFGGKK